MHTRTMLQTALTVAVVTSAAAACSVPVCRFALERWPADPYRALVFYRGTLSNEQAALLRQFDPDEFTGLTPSNLILETVDVDDMHAQFERYWAEHQTDDLPLMVVFYPQTRSPAGIPRSIEGVWKGPFNEQSIRKLVDSPARRKAARLLAQGTSAVWLLLEGGNCEPDDAAETLLRTRLAHLETTLELSQPDAADLAGGLIKIDPSAMKLSFRCLRVSREDAAESFLVRSLLGSEHDLRDEEFAGQPMAFPVFGRGRALYALIGKGINHETIDEACRFLIGPCSCQVKEQNPGTDLLMTVPWDDLVNATIEIDTALPPLTGLSGFVEPEPVVETEPVVAPEPVESERPAKSDSPLIAVAQSGAIREAGSAIAPDFGPAGIDGAHRGVTYDPAPPGRLFRNVAITALLLIAAVAIVSMLVIRKPS